MIKRYLILKLFLQIIQDYHMIKNLIRHIYPLSNENIKEAWIVVEEWILDGFCRELKTGDKLLKHQYDIL